ncbi:oligoribonuclease [Burkholderiales bacterium]|jgi:oligoribonuclease|nr:oligoribonuclease [Betaproteobacteria bacterium]MDA9295811.1 oligoribonuclease [Burkholderiales bacterium]
MPQSTENLIWLDMEMTGLAPDRDHIIELAIVVTDSNLNQLDDGAVWVIHQSDNILDQMDDWNTRTHGKSGLIERVKNASHDVRDVEEFALKYLSKFVPTSTSPMCGNSICQDRRFMAKWMPKLESYFHYRNLDVSTLKELAKRWRPEVTKGLIKHGKHEALADVYESIEELKHYREHFIVD